MNATPIIALDVDGVINCFLRGNVKEPFGDYRSVEAAPTEGERTYEITFSPTVIRTLLDLHESGAAQIVWLTTWGEGANGELSQKLGFPGDFIVAGEKPLWASFTPMNTQGVFDGEYRWWKFTHMERLADEHPNAKIVWIDDDLAFDHESVEWVDAQDGRVLGVCPDTNLGLIPEELDLIKKFLEVES